MKVSVLILTHDEEANLPACLSALSWCDDILVLDSGSTDRTLHIATSNGARILSRPFDNFAYQRNHGLEFGEFRHDWVLHLDADEIVTPEFASAIKALTPPAGVYAYRIPSKAILFGHWLRYAGMWPVYQVRLGERTHLRFKQVGHGQQEHMPSGRIGEFPEPYLHYSFSHGMRRWLEKHVRYAEDEAKYVWDQRARSNFSVISAGAGDGTSLRRRAKALAAHLPLFSRPFARFVYIYFLRQGFRDGRVGLAYAVMLSVYEGMVSVFSYESMLVGHDSANSLLSSTGAAPDAESPTSSAETAPLRLQP